METKQQNFTTLALTKSVRKALPPPSKAFKDKRGKQDRKAWRKEVW